MHKEKALDLLQEIDKCVIEWINVIHIFGAALRSLFDQKVGLEQEMGVAGLNLIPKSGYSCGP